MRRAILLLFLCVLFAIASPAQTFTTMYDFQGLTDSRYPWASLVQGVDGSYYGEAQGDYYGSNDPGSVFKINSSGVFTTVHHFDINNLYEPAGPIGGLVRTMNGDLYGAGGGGYYGAGTVFKVTPQDTVTTIYSFCALGAPCPDGTAPWAPPVPGADGNLYGTTGTGGSTDCQYGCGTVYRLTPGGSLTTLYTFHGPDGANPHARLLLASDGNFYGTTFRGGSTLGTCNSSNPPGCGTIFRITPGGVLTTLHIFCTQAGCPDGARPPGGLIQGSDGYLYGMTGSVGATATIFRMSLQGELITLYKFPAGWGALGELLQAPDGNFYGMVCCGGTPGSIFSMTPDGTVTTLHTFCQQYPCPGGQNPEGSLVLGSDGLFYGTTEQGGDADGYGTIFSFYVGFVPLSVTKTGSGTVLGVDGHINCGTTCSYAYTNGAQVKLSPIPAAGFTFTGWTGCDQVQNNYCVVTLDNPRNVTAAFTSSPVTLTSLVLKPSTVKGGQLSAGTVTLSAAAPDGGLGVSIASGTPNAAHPPAWIVVPGGKTTASFAVQTYPVKKTTTVNISASTGGSHQSATLTVTTGYGSQQSATVVH